MITCKAARNIKRTLGIKAAIGFMKGRDIGFDVAYVWMFGHAAYGRMMERRA